MDAFDHIVRCQCVLETEHHHCIGVIPDWIFFLYLAAERRKLNEASGCRAHLRSTFISLLAHCEICWVLVIFRTFKCSKWNLAFVLALICGGQARH